MRWSSTKGSPFGSLAPRVAVITFLAVAIFHSTELYAGLISGSTLVTTSDLGQLEAWLGQGPLQLTNIFTRDIGGTQTSANFHQAVDGKGPTFVFLEVLGSDGKRERDRRRLTIRKAGIRRQAS